MTSLAINPDGDLILEGADLVRDEGLATAILVSLLMDRRADDVRPEDNRGWWADVDEDPVGSLLWLLERGKATQQTAAAARDHAARALAWLTDEGIADRIEVSAEIPSLGVLVLRIEITRGTASRWSALWDAFSSLDYPWEGGTLRVIAV